MTVEWINVPNSSNIAKVGFDEDNQELLVQFKSGGTYSYSGASASIAEDLAGDPSPGGYFIRWVKNRYPAKKVPS